MIGISIQNLYVKSLNLSKSVFGTFIIGDISFHNYPIVTMIFVRIIFRFFLIICVFMVCLIMCDKFVQKRSL